MDSRIRRVLATTDHYSVLGLKRSASAGEVKQAYKSAAKDFHPDRCRHPDATAAFQKISQAYSVLGNEDKRRMYDIGSAKPSKPTSYTFPQSRPKREVQMKNRVFDRVFHVMFFVLVVVVFLYLLFSSTVHPNLVEQMDGHVFFKEFDSRGLDDTVEFKSERYRQSFYVERDFILDYHKGDQDRAFRRSLVKAADKLYVKRLQERCTLEKESSLQSKPSCYRLKMLGKRF